MSTIPVSCCKCIACLVEKGAKAAGHPLSNVVLHSALRPESLGCRNTIRAGISQISIAAEGMTRWMVVANYFKVQWHGSFVRNYSRSKKEFGGREKGWARA